MLSTTHQESYGLFAASAHSIADSITSAQRRCFMGPAKMSAERPLSSERKSRKKLLSTCISSLKHFVSDIKPGREAVRHETEEGCAVCRRG